jgi:hypothetical protein
MTVTYSKVGFLKAAEFEDQGGQTCTVQESSWVEAGLWLEIPRQGHDNSDDSEPRRALFSRDQVRDELLPLLQHFAETGSLPDGKPTSDPARVLLSSAQADVHAGRATGVVCACCAQFCKTYKRKLDSTMARALMWLVFQADAEDRNWVNIQNGPKWLLKTKPLATTRHWGLIEPMPADMRDLVSDGKRSSGIWRPTELGVSFVFNRARVPSHVFIYNNQCVGAPATTTDIVDALGRGFNYQELMSS